MPLFLHSLAQGFRPRTCFTRTGYTLTPRRAARLRSCTSLQDIHAINLAVYWVFAWVLVTSCTSKQNVYAVMLVCMPGREGPPCRAYEGPTCPCKKKCRGPCHEQKTLYAMRKFFGHRSSRSGLLALQSLVQQWHRQRINDQERVLAAADGFPAMLLLQVARFNDRGHKLAGCIHPPFTLQFPAFTQWPGRLQRSVGKLHCQIFHLSSR